MGFKRLIKTYDFTTRIRKDLVFSDTSKIRLNDDDKLDQKLSLVQIGNAFDTGETNTVRTPIHNPQRVKKWLAFEAVEDIPANTSIGYRLVVLNGTKEIYWDGAAWSDATLDTHYNTQAEIQTNISSYVLEDFDLALKIKLKSDDGVSTPTVSTAKFLAQVFIDGWDDLIYDTVIASMRSSLRAATAIEFAVASTTSVIDLASDYKLENSGYNFTNGLAAYNLTTDPKKFRNIFDSYTPGTARPDGTFEDGQVNLTEAVNQDDIVRLEMEFEPEVAVYTNQDYYEPARLPALVFEKIRTVRIRGRHDQELNDGEGESIRDIANNAAVRMPRPRQSTVLFDFALHGRPMDIARLSDAIDKWIGDNRTLNTFAWQDKINMDPVNEIDTGGSSNLDDVVIAEGSFQLRGVPFYVRDAVDEFLVLEVNATYESQ